MVGILALGVLVPLVPYTILRGVALVGLRRRKRWGAILTMVLAAVVIIAAVVVAHDVPGVLAVMLIYAGATAWATFGCLNRP